jgi:hypothetical protein
MERRCVDRYSTAGPGSLQNNDVDAIATRKRRLGGRSSGHPLRRSPTSCAATASKSARTRARGSPARGSGSINSPRSTTAPGFGCLRSTTRATRAPRSASSMTCSGDSRSGCTSFSDSIGGLGIVARDIRAEVSQVFDRARRPDDDHARGAFRSRFWPHERSHFATFLCGTPWPSSSSVSPF